MGVVSLRSSLSISVVVHFFLLIIWTILVGQRTAITPKQFTFVELEPLPEKFKKQISESNSKRLVQTSRGQEVDKAAPDAFLGEKTQVVDRQTVNVAKTTSVALKQKTRSKIEEAVRDEKALQRKTVISKFGVPIFSTMPQGKKLLNPDQDRPWAIIDESMPQDYVRGLKESERTALNTKEYVFFGYFQRIRQRLDLAWTRTLRDQLMKLYKGGRRLATDMDHTTKVLVTLNKQGEIVRVQVVEESGTRDLDDAAISAFNRAGPFPNPPKGIVDNKGEIQIRWDFVLKT